jgi:hypothetical protein
MSSRIFAVSPFMLVFASAAPAQNIAYDNFGPGNAYNNLSGYFVRGPFHASTSPDWTQGFQFTSAATGGITELLVPLRYTQGENNFRFEVRIDENNTPGGVRGQFENVQGGPTSSTLVSIPGDGSIQLVQGQVYWLVLFAINTADGTWSQNNTGANALRALSRNQGASWTYGTLNAPAFRITVHGGPAVCYPNCDASTVAPILNVGDFTCFLQRFAAGESYANCDNSTVQPVLNVGDFTCFLQRFAAGCP